jgi:pimeloyl-ACP methyl ester carboxylesterase
MTSGRDVRLEYEWVGAARTTNDVVVFLHEGLGSISMWRDFPRAFCDRHGLAGFVFSRYGYGRSTPKPPGERWGTDFMAEQANEVLPKLFRVVGSATATAPRSRSCTRRGIRPPA